MILEIKWIFPCVALALVVLTTNPVACRSDPSPGGLVDEHKDRSISIHDPFSHKKFKRATDLGSTSTTETPKNKKKNKAGDSDASTTSHPKGASNPHPSTTDAPTSTKPPKGGRSRTRKPTPGKRTMTTMGSTNGPLSSTTSTTYKPTKDKRRDLIEKQLEEKAAIEYAIAGLNSWKRAYEKNRIVLNRPLAGEFLHGFRTLEIGLKDQVQTLIDEYKLITPDYEERSGLANLMFNEAEQAAENFESDDTLVPIQNE